MGVSHACIGWDKGIKTCSSKLCGGPCRCKLLCKGPLVKEPVCRGEWTTSAWEHPLCQSTHACERAHVCINTHARMHTHTHTRTHTGNVCIFPLSPSASPAVIDVLFHSAQHKLRHHGYSCRDVLSPGDRQYWNNNSLNNTTNHTHTPSPLATHPLLHSPSGLSCLARFAV